VEYIWESGAYSRCGRKTAPRGSTQSNERDLSPTNRRILTVERSSSSEVDHGNINCQQEAHVGARGLGEIAARQQSGRHAEILQGSHRLASQTPGYRGTDEQPPPLTTSPSKYPLLISLTKRRDSKRWDSKSKHMDDFDAPGKRFGPRNAAASQFTRRLTHNFNPRINHVANDDERAPRPWNLPRLRVGFSYSGDPLAKKNSLSVVIAFVRLA
jgi:hypothetical protein